MTGSWPGWFQYAFRLLVWLNGCFWNIILKRSYKKVMVSCTVIIITNKYLLNTCSEQGALVNAIMLSNILVVNILWHEILMKGRIYLIKMDGYPLSPLELKNMKTCLVDFCQFLKMTCWFSVDQSWNALKLFFFFKRRKTKKILPKFTGVPWQEVHTVASTISRRKMKYEMSSNLVQDQFKFPTKKKKVWCHMTKVKKDWLFKMF